MQNLTLKNEFSFSEQDFLNISKLVTSHTGIELPINKKSLVYSRLVRRVRALSLNSFADYYTLVKSNLNQGDDKEFLGLINAITTNVTHFFREPHHFEHLEKALNGLAKSKNKVRIWSCAASIGAEPWSIAMVAHECKKKNPSCDIQIIASDIDSEVLQQAEKGIYDMSPQIVSSNLYLKNYLNIHDVEIKHKSPSHKVYQIKNEIRPYVQFKKINLLHNWHDDISSPYDFIFCRNVVIYFSKTTQETLFKKISKVMNQDAYLYLGHSESLFDVSDDFINLKHTTYQKVK